MAIDPRGGLELLWRRPLLDIEHPDESILC
jgi:hypothetical protein